MGDGAREMVVCESEPDWKAESKPNRGQMFQVVLF